MGSKVLLRIHVGHLASARCPGYITSVAVYLYSKTNTNKCETNRDAAFLIVFAL